MHERLCTEISILALIVKIFEFEKRIVVVIGLHVELSCNWLFHIFTQ